MTTTEIYEDINDMILLSPSAEHVLKRYLKRLDGATIVDDLEEEEQ